MRSSKISQICYNEQYYNVSGDGQRQDVAQRISDSATSSIVLSLLAASVLSNAVFILTIIVMCASKKRVKVMPPPKMPSNE